MAQFKENNPGKPKGAQNKVNKLVKDFVSDVFNRLQTDPKSKAVKADLYGWAKENPKEFYQIASKLIPVQMEHSGEFNIVWNETKNYGTEPKTDDSP